MHNKILTYITASALAVATLGTSIPVLASGTNAITIGAGKFTNTWKADPATIDLGDKDTGTGVTGTGDGLRKVLEDKSNSGKTVANTTFKFKITEYTDDSYKTVKKDGEGTNAKEIVYDVTSDSKGEIHYDFKYDKAGTHYYRITEVDEKVNGMTYDNTKVDVKVDVTGSNGTLTAKATMPEDYEFNNTYKAESIDVTLTATKEINDVSGSGKTLENAGEFTFALYDASGNPVKNKKGDVITAKSDTKGNITFEAIEFEQCGTYTYVITETAGSDKHFTYDGSYHTVKITVTDDNGTLKATGELATSNDKPSTWGTKTLPVDKTETADGEK